MRIDPDHIEFLAGGAAVKVGQFFWSIFNRRLGKFIEAKLFSLFTK